MTLKDVKTILLYWALDRCEKLDEKALAAVGLDTKNVAWAAGLTVTDIEQLARQPGAVELRVNINAKSLFSTSKIQAQFLHYGASNEMMRYLFPDMSKRSLTCLRHSLNLDTVRGRQKNVSIEDADRIHSTCRELQFVFHRYQSWWQLHEKLGQKFLLGQLWDVLNGLRKKTLRGSCNDQRENGHLQHVSRFSFGREP